MPRGIKGPVDYDRTLADRGKRARKSAEERQGRSDRITPHEWYPSLVQMKDYGYTQRQTAWAVGLSERQVRNIFKWGREEGRDYFYEDLPPAPSGEPLRKLPVDMSGFNGSDFKVFYEYCNERDLPNHCIDWVQEFCDNRLLMLNIPPRHMKSTIFSLWVPIWLLCLNRDEQIILVSKTNDLAVRWASDIANQLEFNRRITGTWGRFVPERTRNSPWRPARGQLLVLGRQREARGMQMSILARGSGQQILGMEATVAIVDDPTDVSVAKSEVERVRELDWLRSEVFTRLETQSMGQASGRAVVIGQRVHYQDLYGQLEELKNERGPDAGKPLFKTIKHAAVSDWTEGKTLWPEKWNVEELTHEYNRIGSTAFSTMFQQEPLPPEARLVDPAWWEACREYQRPGGVGYRMSHSEATVPVSRVLSLDPSPRNYNGLVVCDVVFDRTQFYTAIVEAKHFVGPLRDIKAEITRCVDEYRPDYFIMEHSTFTTWFTEDPFYLEVKSRVKCIPHQTFKNKGDPDLGVESLGADVEGGRILLPYGDAAGRRYSELLELETNTWPFGKTDDVLMALWFVKWNYRRLVPPGVYSGHFQGRQPASWSFLTRKQTTQDVVDRYRKEHSVASL